MNPFLLKALLLMAVAFIGGMHLGKSQNPKYDEDGLGPEGHRIVATIFITGSFLGMCYLIWEIIQIMARA